MQYDVIVIGGGHAGTEAAHAAARMGGLTALVTLSKSRIGFMSCNPAMGGLAKGQLVKEIDALGGIMGRNTDRTAIQFRRLNESKGPAVRSSRAQCDKALYASEMQRYLAGIEGLSILETEVTGLWEESGRVVGVCLPNGEVLRAKAVVVTSGTFLRALMFTGDRAEEGGRVGDGVSKSLSGSLERLGFRLKRLKTGTPPRLRRQSINYTALEEQKGDLNPIPFSFYGDLGQFPVLPQVSCWITYTNTQTHEIIEKNLSRSPMFSGLIQGIGPRYCPSIEDKVKRFRDKERHQLFLEPEGLTTDEVYVNGISTSLPADVQESFVRSIAGLEQAEFLRYGYAVEYDAVDARQLKLTLESKDIPGLFFAGQVNGTSGYEEAGAQGIVAGINAARLAKQEAPWTLGRHEAYIGVMIDDLVLKGADEPYRMFTSRAEYRLLLREDNADLRLAARGHEAGVLSAQHMAQVDEKRERIEKLKTHLSQSAVFPRSPATEWMAGRAMPALKDRVMADVFLRRPEVKIGDLGSVGVPLEEQRADVLEQVEIQTKYAGYIQRDLELMEGVRKHEGFQIPNDLNYGLVPGLSHEVRGRLVGTRPETIGQASRIAGITPAAMANLMIYLRMQERAEA